MKTKYELRQIGPQLWNYRGYNIKEGIEGGYAVMTDDGDFVFLAAATMDQMRRALDSIEKRESKK